VKNWNLLPDTIEEWSLKGDYGLNKNLETQALMPSDILKELTEMHENNPTIFKSLKHEDIFDDVSGIQLCLQSDNNAQNKKNILFIGNIGANNDQIGLEIIIRTIRHYVEGK